MLSMSDSIASLVSTSLASLAPPTILVSVIRIADITSKLGKNASGPKRFRTRLITKGTPPAPSDEAMANIAESTEVSSTLSLAMLMVIA